MLDNVEGRQSHLLLLSFQLGEEEGDDTVGEPLSCEQSGRNHISFFSLQSKEFCSGICRCEYCLLDEAEAETLSHATRRIGQE